MLMAKNMASDLIFAKELSYGLAGPLEAILVILTDILAG